MLPEPVTVASLSIPNTITFEQWLDTGRQLASTTRDLGFMIGDWVNHGREHFGEQIEMALEQTGLDGRFAIKAAHVAKAFPEPVRNHALSFEHHRAVLRLPRPEQLDLLKQAGDKHWKPQKLREAVVQRRYERGDDFPPDEVDSAMLTVIVRAWNRATPKAREDFLMLAKACNGGVIDEEKVYD